MCVVREHHAHRLRAGAARGRGRARRLDARAHGDSGPSRKHPRGVTSYWDASDLTKGRADVLVPVPAGVALASPSWAAGPFAPPDRPAWLPERVPWGVNAAAGVSFGTALCGTGALLLGAGFTLYFGDGGIANNESALGASGPLLIYGFFAGLLGPAMVYTELAPVEAARQESVTPAELERQATSTQVSIVNDVTRFRYGDELHLEEALGKVFMVDRITKGGIFRDDMPELKGLKQRLDDAGRYCLTLEFHSPWLPPSRWLAAQDKMTSFFGPGLEVNIDHVAGTHTVELHLTSDGTSAGKDERLDPKMPLMPGLAPRKRADGEEI